jgi:hypothetical protein
MNDPVAGGIGVTQGRERGPDRRGARRATRRRQIRGARHLVRAVEHAQLEAAGSGIDHQDTHRIAS